MTARRPVIALVFVSLSLLMGFVYQDKNLAVKELREFARALQKTPSGLISH